MVQMDKLEEKVDIPADIWDFFPSTVITFTSSSFFISEKFDASFLIVYLQNLFSTNKANAAICGWLDLDKEGYHVFLSLITQDEKGKALTAENLKENYEQFKTRA